MQKFSFTSNQNSQFQTQTPFSNVKMSYVQQKATFYFDENTRGFSQTDTFVQNYLKKDKRKNKPIHFWPNYPIKHEQIQINSSLPQLSATDKKIKPLNVDFQQQQILTLEQKALAVGQVFVVYVERENFLDFQEISCATFSIVEFKNKSQNYDLNDIYGLTVAHLFMDNPQQNKGDYYRLIFVSLSEHDTFEDFKKSLQLFKVKKRKQILQKIKENEFKIKEFSKFLQDYLQYEDKYFKQQPIFQAYINYEFLEYRRELIYTLSESKQTHQYLLDPINGLQCLPSIDCCLLSFDENMNNYISRNQIQPLIINHDIHKKSHQEGDVLALIGYQQVEGSIFQKKDSTYSLNIFNNKSQFQPIEVNKIVDPHKTLQTGQFAKSNNYILTFESSTTQGSSGSPLIDLDGNLIGINTGYFDDITEYEDTEDTITFKDLINYDQNVIENEQNYHKIKNYNCGVDVNHIIFYAFANRDLSIFQQIYSRDPQELRKSIPTIYQYQISTYKKQQK